MGISSHKLCIFWKQIFNRLEICTAVAPTPPLQQRHSIMVVIFTCRLATGYLFDTARRICNNINNILT